MGDFLIWNGAEELDQLVEYCSTLDDAFVSYFKYASFGTFHTFFANYKKFLSSGIVKCENDIHFTLTEKRKFITDLVDYIKNNYKKSDSEAIFSSLNSSFKSTTSIDISASPNSEKNDDSFIVKDGYDIDRDNTNDSELEKNLIPFTENDNTEPEDTNQENQIDAEGVAVNGEDESENIIDKGIFSLNKESEYNKCIRYGQFAISELDFEVESTEIDKKWRTSPAFVIRECAKDGVVIGFPSYFSRFAFDIFKRIGQIYPYEIPVPVLDRISQRFCEKFPELNQLYKDYDDKFKCDRNAKFTKLPEASVVLAKKIKNKFKYRGTLLKADGLWLYSDDKKGLEQSRIDSKNTKKENKKRKRKDDEFLDYELVQLQKMTAKFNYKAKKARLEHSIDKTRSERMLADAARADAKL